MRLSRRVQLLQPKQISLRLNLEQVQHIADGLLDNRAKFEGKDLDLYDSQTADVLEQFEQQRVFFPDVDLDILPAGQDDANQEEMDRLHELLDLIATRGLPDISAEMRKIIFGE